MSLGDLEFIVTLIQIISVSGTKIQSSIHGVWVLEGLGNEQQFLFMAEDQIWF